MTIATVTDISRVTRGGADALLRRQRPGGAFGDNAPASVLGTAGAAAALHAADPAAHADLVSNAGTWLRAEQQADGGWGGVTGSASEVVPTAIAVASLAMTAAQASATAIESGRACLARFGGVDAVTDPAIAFLCRQFLAMAGLPGEAGRLRRLPLEIVLADRVRRRRISFRTAPFIGLALMQQGMFADRGLRRATLGRARNAGLALLRSIYDHEGRTGEFSADPWPAALVLLGLARAGAAPDMAGAIAGWLRQVVRPDGAWDAVANLDLTRSAYAATGLAAAGYAADDRLHATRELFHASQQQEGFPVLGVPPGGWSFSSARGWPVVLESAEILSALAAFPGSDEDAVLRSGCEWLLGRQDTRGSWSLWVRDTKLANDGPCPAITSQAIGALLDAGYPAGHRSIVAACGWLRTQQRPDGSFENLWYRDYTSGTAVVAAALARAGLARDPVTRRAVDWLCRSQMTDGSWGPGDGTDGSAEETAWAVLGLLAAGGPGTAENADRGVGWLVAAALPDGGWRPARVCNYIRHHMRYPNAVITQGLALRALGEYAGMPARAAAGEAR